MTSKGSLVQVEDDSLMQRDLTEFICGWGAAVVNITITFPLNKIIFRQMLHNVGVNNAVQQISAEGVLFLYRGILPPLLQKSISTSLMFGIYESCRGWLAQIGVTGLASSVIAANIAGTTEALLTPFERIQTLMQTTSYHERFKNSQHAVRIIALQYGIKEFYRGFIPVLLRNGPSNTFFFIMREEAHKVLPKPKSFIGTTTNEFVIGAVIGAMGSTLFYPLNVIKVHLQSQLGGPHQSTWAAVGEIYHSRDGSLRKFYRGVHMNYTRSFISWGIINVAYEHLKRLLHQE